MKKLFIVLIISFGLITFTGCVAPQEDGNNYKFSDLFDLLNDSNSYQVVTTVGTKVTTHKVDGNMIEETTASTTKFQVKDDKYKVYEMIGDEWYLSKEEYSSSQIILPFSSFAHFDIYDFEGEGSYYSLTSKNLHKYEVLNTIPIMLNINFDFVTATATFEYKLSSVQYTSVYTLYDEISLEEPHDPMAEPENFELIKNFYDLYATSLEYTYIDNEKGYKINYKGDKAELLGDDFKLYTSIDFDSSITYFDENGDLVEDNEIDLYEYLLKETSEEDFLAAFYGAQYQDGEYIINYYEEEYIYKFNDEYTELSIYSSEKELYKQYKNLNNVEEIVIPGYTPKVQIEELFSNLKTSYTSVTTWVDNLSTQYLNVSVDYTDDGIIIDVERGEVKGGTTSIQLEQQTYYILDNTKVYLYTRNEDGTYNRIFNEEEVDGEQLGYFNLGDVELLEEVMSIYEGDLLFSDFIYQSGSTYTCSAVTNNAVKYTDVVLTYDFDNLDTTIIYTINGVKYTTSYKNVNNNNLNRPVDDNIDTDL